jgi:phosphoglycolate phosphatase
MPAPTIAFDLDGTLIDTAPDLLDSLNRCLEMGGLAQANVSELKRYVGFGGRVMIERAFQAHGKPLAADQLDRLYAAFIEDYLDGIPGKSAPYPGVVAALDRLAAAGCLLAVCTNKMERHSRRLLGRWGWPTGSRRSAARIPFPIASPIHATSSARSRRPAATLSAR